MKLNDFYSQVCKRYKEVGFGGLSQLDKFVLVVVEFQGQMNSGGLDPYFFNSSGDSTPVLLDAFDAIGAVEARNLTTDALAVFDPVGGYTTNQDARIERLNQLDIDACAEKFTPLNRRLGEMVEEISQQLEIYLTRNAQNA